MDIYREINKHIADKDQHIVIGITNEYIQEFVEANYNRKLTKTEIQKLSWLVWEDGDCGLINWIDEAIRIIIDDSKHKSKK